MTNYAKLSAGAVAAAIVIASFTWFVLANRPANLCLNFYQEKVGANLKLVSSERVGPSTWITVSGGPDETRSKAVCEFGSDGKVNAMGTDMAWITKLMNEMSICLDRNNKLWNEREAKFEGRTQNCGEEAISRRGRWVRIFNDGDLSATFGRQ